jgi:hypothetical protein
MGRTALRQKAMLHTASRHAALAQLALVIGGCQSARQESKSDLELRTPALESEAAQVTDSVQSSFLQARERAAAGTLSDAAPKASGSPAAPAKAAAPKGAAPTAAAPAQPTSAGARPSRALDPADTVRFRRLKTAIERANAEVERHRPRAP